MNSEESGNEHERRFHGDAARLRAPDRIERLEVARVVALSLEGIKAASVLDVGTGTGLFAEAFASLVESVAGVDTNGELLAIARSHVPSALLAEGPAEKLPFPDGSFDLVFMGTFLHEADDPLAALSEARRVSRLRVAILEWPFKEEESGPPIGHRLRPEAIEEIASKAGLHKADRISLARMELYRFSRQE